MTDLPDGLLRSLRQEIEQLGHDPDCAAFELLDDGAEPFRPDGRETGAPCDCFQASVMGVVDSFSSTPDDLR